MYQQNLIKKLLCTCFFPKGDANIKIKPRTIKKYSKNQFWGEKSLNNQSKKSITDI